MPNRWRATAPYLIAALALAARLIPTPRTIDDAFITFRYARNLLAGAGFVFNPGEHVLGTTTPLYTLLMAALAALFHTSDYPWLALIVNALADAGTCILLVMLGQRLSGGRRVGLAAALLWAVAPMSVTFAIGGMETSVFIFLMIATFTLYLSPEWPSRQSPISNLYSLTAALALLTRPDALIFLGPLAFDLALRLWLGRKQTGLAHFLLPSSFFLIPLLVWIIFATFYFGTPIPHSITAKVVAYHLQPGESFIRLIQHYATPFFDQLVLGNWWQLGGFIVYLILYCVSGLASIRRDSRAWPLVAYPLLYLIAFSLANPLLFRWYLAPPLPMYFIGILGGLDKVISDMSNQIAVVSSQKASVRQSPITIYQLPLNLQSPISNLLFLLPTAFFLFCSLNAWTLHPDHGPDRPAPQMAWHKLELLYTQVGRELATQIEPGALVAAGDVGALGYYSNARLLDTVGLNSPEATAYYPLPDSAYVINYAIPTDLILDRRPDYVVILEVYGRNTFLPDSRFQAEYDLIKKIPTDIYGSRGLLIFRLHP